MAFRGPSCSLRWPRLLQPLPFPTRLCGESCSPRPPQGPPGGVCVPGSPALPAIQVKPSCQSLCSLSQLEKILETGTAEQSLWRSRPGTEGPGQGSSRPGTCLRALLPNIPFCTTGPQSRQVAPAQRKENLKPGRVSPASFPQRALKIKKHKVTKNVQSYSH